jgi:hypothetical protein
MGYIIEPEGIDFTVVNRPLTEADRLLISNAIAEYKRTGVVPERIPIATLKTKKPIKNAIDKKSIGK